MLTGIDHVIVAVRDLAAAERDYARLGLRAVGGGVHTGGATHNALVGLGPAYLELLAPNPEAPPPEPGSLAATLLDFLATGEGLFYFALRSDDLASDLARLRSAGASYRDLARGGAELPDGTRRGWTTGPRPRPADLAHPFLIQHDELAGDRPAWFARLGLDRPGPLGAPRLRALRLAAGDLAHATAEYAREYGLTAEGATIRLRDNTIELLDAQPRGPRELVLEVADLDAVRNHLRRQGIAATDRPDGTLMIDPAAARGALLVVAGPGMS